MPMVCPQCSGSFEQQLHCPSCGTRLQFQANTFILGSSGVPGEESQWQHTPWGRMIVGLFLAQGLAHGLQMLFKAGFLATGDETGQSAWDSLGGMMLAQTIQAVCLLIGGALTGAGQNRGVLFGSLVGLIHGLTFLLIESGRGIAPTELTQFGQPILHLAFGAVGGFIGTKIWKPLPVIKLPTLPQTPAKTVAPPKPKFDPFAGPVCWVRVLAGIAIALSGIVWSRYILTLVVEASQGALSIHSNTQAQLVCWEISALAALLGAGWAGATTANGLKQGLVAGLGTSILVVGIHLSNPKNIMETTTLMVASIMVLSLAGSWFGCQLFPPVAAGRRKTIAQA